MREIYSIAKNSFMELLRQPVFLILTSVSAVFIIFLAISPYFGLGYDVNLVKTSALAVLLLAGLFTSVFSASTSLAAELRGGTALAVLSKPVNRIAFLLGKLFGVCSAISIMVYINIIAILFASRMGFDSYGKTDFVGMAIFFGAMILSFAISGFLNYFLEKNFVPYTMGILIITMTIGLIIISFLEEERKLMEYSTIDWSLIPAAICLTFMLWLIAALAITCSTRLNTIATLTFCLIILLIGLMSDYFFGQMSNSGSWIGTILYTIIPNWQNFWLADAIENDKGIPWLYIRDAFLYMITFMVATITIGITLFDNRELN